jgi:hypothetical protein
MSFIPDEQEKTVKIPIQVRNGRIQFYFHGPLPDLKEGIIGDLVVPSFEIQPWLTSWSRCHFPTQQLDLL